MNTSSASKRRLRMRQWLTLLLDRETTPGIRWEDKSNSVFRINWKHGSRHGYLAERDALVFRKWAEYTGKVDNKSAPDPKRWKANFRCALNSLKDVVQLNGKHSRGVHAFRLYQFTPIHRTRPLPPIATEKRCSASFRCTRDVIKMTASDDNNNNNNNLLPAFIKVEPSELYGSCDGYSSSRRSVSESSDVSATDDQTTPFQYGGFFGTDSFYNATIVFQETAQLPSFQKWTEAPPPYPKWTESLPPTDDLDILNTYQTELVNFNEFNDFDEVR